MNMQNAPEPIDRYPLLKKDIEVEKRAILQHTSLARTFEPMQTLKTPSAEFVLAPALSIIAEDAEEGAEEVNIVKTAEVATALYTTPRFKHYSHALVCCRNQLGIGMSNPGPR